MVKYIKPDGKVVNLSKEKFFKLMHALKKRAQLQREEKAIAEIAIEERC